ncbi:MAG: DUF72 domain-containing protein [Thermodesulfobacteriota bacterium]
MKQQTDPLPQVHMVQNHSSAQESRVRIGTSGYSYTEWVDGGFYPSLTKTPDMLPLYGQKFSVVELNYTWYQMVRAEAVERMVSRAPDHFCFAAKLTRTLTHEVDAGWPEQLRSYRQGIAPLKNRLLAILIQLPPDFDWTHSRRSYLARLLDGLAGLPLAVEFRHRSWARDSVFAELEKRGVTLVTVDAPQLPGLFPLLDVVTNPDLFYIRFHGRNERGWRSANMQQKFDYDYSEEELKSWLRDHMSVICSRASSGAVFFNNHVRAQAPRNARLFGQLLAAG